MRSLRRLALILVAALNLPAAVAAQSTPVQAPEPADPFLWMEDVQGDRALSWVRERNARSLGVLEGDSRFAGLNRAALEIVNASDRIPAPAFAASRITNFWQDSTHVRGIWRRTTLASYRSATPVWETILDIDALARDEGKNWVFKGAECLEPAERYCLVQLSDGGKDAVTIREYDIEAKRFIEGGFTFPECKQDATWIDRNTLLVGREWARISPDPAVVPDSGEILWDGRFLIQAPPQAQVVPVGRLHGVARREEIPGFVQQSLPAVLLGDGGVIIPHLAAGPGVSAKFIRRLR